MEARINGIRTFYLDEGPRAGRPVVLIHGFPLNHEMWGPQIERLRDNHRVLAYDVRGHGRTEVGDGLYTIDLFVDDLLGLLDHVGMPAPVLCGLSMGGYIALRAIERRPERFSGLILCDTRAETDTNEAKLKRVAAMRQVKEDGVKPFANAFLLGLFTRHALEADTPPVQLTRRMIESTAEVAIRGTSLALAARPDMTASLASIRTPTLVVVGEDDTITPPDNARALHAGIRGSELRLIPHAGHMSNLEQPGEFNRHLLDFLSRI